MKKSNRLFGLLSVFALSVSAQAGVVAMPSYYDFGPVAVGDWRETSITFMNQSPIPIQNFNVRCSGDYSAYSCFSMCGRLPSYGTCQVRVRFTPVSGNGQRLVFWLNGSGGGASATSTIYGTDKKTPAPRN